MHNAPGAKARVIGCWRTKDCKVCQAIKEKIPLNLLHTKLSNALLKYTVAELNQYKTKQYVIKKYYWAWLLFCKIKFRTSNFNFTPPMTNNGSGLCAGRTIKLLMHNAPGAKARVNGCRRTLHHKVCQSIK